MNDPYIPEVELEKEVKRFFDTNTFTPMQVTGFYIHARCVLTDLKESRERGERFKKELDSSRKECFKLEKQLFEAEEKIISLENEMAEDCSERGCP